MADWPKLKAGKEALELRDFDNFSHRGASRGASNAKASLCIHAASP